MEEKEVLSVENLSNIFDAISHPNRLRMLRSIAAAGELKSGDIADQVGVSKQMTTKHLRILENAGLVESRRDKNNIFYSVRKGDFGQALMQTARDANLQLCADM